MDRRHVRRREDARGVGLDELLVVARRERADPRVEHLDDVGARARLRGDVARELLGQLVKQRVPDAGVVRHQRLRARKVAARLALDEIAGDRERTAAKADECLPGVELASHQPHRLEDLLVGLGDPQPVDVRARGDRRLHDRADPLDELDPDPHGENGRHDVRKEDGGIDAVASHRLQRHLGAQLRRSGDLEE